MPHCRGKGSASSRPDYPAGQRDTARADYKTSKVYELTSRIWQTGRLDAEDDFITVELIAHTRSAATLTCVIPSAVSPRYLRPQDMSLRTVALPLSSLHRPL